MVSRWPRLLHGQGRWWRAEGKAATPFGRPKLRLDRPLRPGAPPKRLLFLNQYYWPDHASTAQHLTDLAEALAREGYDCHVVCSQGAYQGARQRRPAFERHNGVSIHRLPASALGRKSTLCRMADYLSFYSLAFLRCLAMPRFDLVATLTTPPLIGLVGTLLRRLKGSLHVYWSMDLHPDASMALGKMRAGSPLAAALRRLSAAVYRRADKVVALGPYMADRIAAKGVRAERLVTIPVWSRADEVFPEPRAGHPLRRALGLEDQFIVMYSGNHGLAHSFGEFLAAAARLRDRRDIVFLFVGDGPRRAEVCQAKAREGLENLRLLDYFPRAQLHDSLSLADVHLISMRGPMAGVVVPGKLYGAMASGRPTLFVGPDHCETADTIRQAGCGYTLREGDVDGLVTAITRLAADGALAETLGARGRAAFLAEHDKDVCCARLSALVAELLGAARPAPVPAITSEPLAPHASGSFGLAPSP